MLYFIQCKQRRLYNDECLMKFSGGYVMGAIKKRGRPAFPGLPTGSPRQDPSAYSESIHLLHRSSTTGSSRTELLNESVYPFSQMAQTANGSTQANLRTLTTTVPVRKRPSLREQTNSILANDIEYS